MTDPLVHGSTSDVKNHLPNAENEAHPGSQSSNANNQNTDRQGDSATNTSTSLKGAGDNSIVAPGADAALDIDLKSPRKQDHPAHNSSAGALHGAGANSESHAQ